MKQLPATGFILETPRTKMRALAVCDAAWMFDLNSDPEVMKYTGDAAFTSIEDAARFLEDYLPRQVKTPGRFAVLDKDTGEPLGWCGLRYDETDQAFDLGFRFFRKHWNMGFATETAQAVLAYGFHTLFIPEIIGRAMEENTASVRVLEKIGMTFRSQRQCGAAPGVVYSITREEFEKTKTAG